MGRNKKHGNWKGKKVKSQNVEKVTTYDTKGFVTENKAFEAFYKLQLKQDFASEAEFAEFKAILVERLPVVFRINENVPNYKNFLAKLKDPTYIERLCQAAPVQNEAENTAATIEQGVNKEGEEKKIQEQIKLKNIPWYPRELVWQLSTFRQQLKKNKAYQNLHKLINKATEAGLISRQELVSMLPPLLLDVQSTDLIFDMCAAPGSKTAQLLELLYRDEFLGKGLTTGGVVANDVDYSRAAMLIHQVQRISTIGMMAVNHSAQHFPKLIQKVEVEGGNIKNKQILFDKVMADVPCSGDGAIRKLPQKWSKWSARDGIALHPLQLLILTKAVQVAKVGGLILYSTCSINPIEDEAVVTELFRRCTNDALEIIDIRDKVPGLIVRQGLSSWSVCEEKENIITGKANQPKGEETIAESKEEAKTQGGKSAEDIFNIYNSADQLPQDYKGVIRSSMFPDTPERMTNVIKIQNTIRIMPHDQNTGGFYLALIRKKDNVIFDAKGFAVPKGTEDQVGDLVVSNEQEGVTTTNIGQELTKEDVIPTGEQHQEEEAEEVATDPVESKEVDEEDSGDEEKVVKKDDLDDEKEEEKVDNDAPIVENNKEGEKPVFKKRSKKDQQPVKKSVFESFNDDLWTWIKDCYGLLDDSLKDLLIQQTHGDRKVLMVSSGLKKILDLEKEKSVLNKLNMGAKAFFRNREAFLDDKYPYRLCQDAMLSLFPYITKRKIKCSASDLLTVVDKQNLVFKDLPSEELKQRVKEEGPGCFVLYAENDGPIKDAEYLVCLCHGASISLMVSSELVESLKLRYLDLVDQ